MKNLFLLAAVALGLAHCTDPTEIGGDLLEPTLLPVVFTDSLPVELTTVRADTTLTAALNTPAGFVPVGCLDDPTFGLSSVTVGFELIQRDSVLEDLSSITFDSAVLVLPFDTAAQIGDTLATFAFEVLQAAPGTIDVTEALTSTPLESGGLPLATFAGPAPRAPTTVVRYPADQAMTVDTDTVDFVARIGLSREFIDAVRPALAAASDGSDQTERDSIFIDNFPGLVLRPSDCTATLPALNLSDALLDRIGVRLYYQDFGRTQEYNLSLRRNATAQSVLRAAFAKTYDGSLAERVLSGEVTGDSVALIQGLAGLGVRVNFPDVTSFAGEVVSYALLELPIVRDGFVEPYRTLRVARRNSVGDFVEAGGIDGTFEAPFRVGPEGGFVRRVPVGSGTDSIDVYQLNITAFMQEVASGEADPELFVLTNGNASLGNTGDLVLGNRSIIAGTGAQPHRTRLLLATAELP